MDSFQLKPLFITSFSIPDAWFSLLWSIFEKDESGNYKYSREYTIDKGSFEGHKRLEFDSVTLQITNPNARPLVPEIPPQLGIAPPTSMEYVEQYFMEYLLNPVKKEGESYTYAERINISLSKIIDMLRYTPNTNQAIIEIARPEDIELSDPPCFRCLAFKIINNKLNMYVYARSNDLWSGFPPNIAGLQLLKEYIADEIGVQDGEIIYYSSGLHIYDYQYGLVKKRIYLEC